MEGKAGGCVEEWAHEEAKRLLASQDQTPLEGLVQPQLFARKALRDVARDLQRRERYRTASREDLAKELASRFYEEEDPLLDEMAGKLKDLQKDELFQLVEWIAQRVQMQTFKAGLMAAVGM